MRIAKFESRISKSEPLISAVAHAGHHVWQLCLQLIEDSNIKYR